jgi:hypothetical protein
VQALESAVHAVPEPTFASVGQSALDPVHFSTASHSPAALRQVVALETNASVGHTELEPVQFSATSHGPAEARHCVAAEAKLSAGHALAAPSHVSATSHELTALRQTVPLLATLSVGQVVETPLQVSATSQPPADARQVVPELPAGCWHELLEPSHWSSVHGLLSELHEVPEPSFESAGQAALEPVHFSTASHSPAAARQVVPLATSESAGQVVDEPVQVSAMSHAPAEARHCVPALPAGCVQETLEPSHSSTVHGLPSLVQLVPKPAFESAGHDVDTPLQVSWTSHSPAAERQTVPALPAGQLQTCELHCTAVVQGLLSSIQATVIDSVTEVGESDVSKQVLSLLVLLTQIVKLYGPHVDVEVGASYWN